ncbi:MAG TPA: hypothetical protein VGC23_08105 [Vicinamibacterales bacterium]
MSRSCFSLLLAILTGVQAAAAQADVQPVKPMSQQEMEARVRIDAARRLQMTVDEIQIAETVERTWPDRGLGCNARRGVFEPTPTPGFRILVQAGTQRLTYHTDRLGRVLRCTTPTKPLDRIK